MGAQPDTALLVINRWFARLTECGKAKSHIVNVSGTGLSDILCAVDTYIQEVIT